MEVSFSVTDVPESASSYFNENEESMLLLFVLKVILVVILVVGVIANSSIVILMVAYGFRNVSDVFIGVLCTANVTFLLIFVPLELSEQNIHRMSLVLCRLYQTVHIYFCAISVLSLVLLSYERWSAVTKPMNVRGGKIKTTFAKVVAVIVLASLLSLPFWFVYERNGDENAPNEFALKFAIYFTTIALYLCPLILITVLYACMALTLVGTSAALQEGNHNRHIQTRRNRVSWIVIGLVVSFAICWLPYYLFLILWTTGAGAYVPGLMYVLSYFRSTIYTLNTCTDPLSIYLLGTRFRQNLMKVFRRRDTNENENLTSFQSVSHKPYNRSVKTQATSLLKA
ncbi:Neuromedin-B receptor [Holothuria leucospilota]|uniref:Neuromedin-B receptor n=1 Tax=Holothuria leucospilota TaxID=206669 RepID=A0A9Q1BLG4_HOLLE|nr:Neuromedin-B receptor [Holothuria leucospilota]